MWIQNIGEKLTLSLCDKFGMYRQKKEIEDIAKEKTEPSLSPAVTKVRPESDFPWESNTCGKVLRPSVGSGLEQSEPSANNIVHHETLEGPSLDTAVVWGDPLHSDSP